jgi:hypothetical protein
LEGPLCEEAAGSRGRRGRTRCVQLEVQHSKSVWAAPAGVKLRVEGAEGSPGRNNSRPVCGVRLILGVSALATARISLTTD